jgi:hypothetical protein
MPPLNLIGYSGINYSRSLVKNLIFLILFCSEAAKTKLASRRVSLVYKPTILKFIKLLR